jgi:signal transduction histidine kinase
VEISVADSGTGIAEDDLEKIFNPFFTTKEKGTGLGLAIVHNIIEAHGGLIGVKSTMGKGSVFSITLPLFTQDNK